MTGAISCDDFSTASLGVYMHEPRDAHGKEIMSGMRVRLIVAPPELLTGLPESDQAAIVAAVGKEMVVEEFDSYGHVELMFKDAQDTIHFIWVRPTAVEILV